MNFLLGIHKEYRDEIFHVVVWMINILNHLLNPYMYTDNNELYNMYHPNVQIPKIDKTFQFLLFLYVRYVQIENQVHNNYYLVQAMDYMHVVCIPNS